jgi:hypothetical protein
MYLHRTAAAHDVMMSFQRDDASAIAATLADRLLELAKEILRKCDSSLADSNRDLHTYAGLKTKSAARHQHDCERQTFTASDPQAVFQTTHWHRFAYVDFVILQGTSIDVEMRAAKNLSEGEGLMRVRRKKSN